jgi:mitochondrial fission protein ELM1
MICHNIYCLIPYTSSERQDIGKTCNNLCTVLEHWLKYQSGSVVISYTAFCQKYLMKVLNKQHRRHPILVWQKQQQFGELFVDIQQ